MGTKNERSGENRAGQVNPTEESRTKFAGDATGAVGGSMAPTVAPDTLQHEPQSPKAHKHDPGKSSTDMRDDDWVKEAQGSLLAHEREGVPEGEMPHNLPESAARPRPKA